MMQWIRFGTVFCGVLWLTACDPDTTAPGSVAVSDNHRLLPAGSPARLSAHLVAGDVRLTGGDLPSQRLVGAPLAFAGAEGMAGMPSTDSGVAAPGALGGAMRGDSSIPADDGLNNAQVSGVEEPDLVKSDGEILYIAEQPEPWIYPFPLPAETPPGGIVDALAAPASATRFVARDGIALDLGGGTVVAPDVLVPDVFSPPAARIARYRLDAVTPDAVALPALTLTGHTGYLSQLKLLLASGGLQRLVAIGQSGNGWAWDDWFVRRPFVASQETRVWIFDVADVSHVPAPASLTLKGELVDSRRIDNHLYLVTRYSPSLPTDPLLPAFRIGDATPPLLNAGDCLLPQTAGGFPSLTMIVAVDLANPSASRAACYAGDVYTFYMSRDALYLAATRSNPAFDWSSGIATGVAVEPAVAPDATPATTARPAPAPVETLVHRFALNDGNPRYTGSGLVDGGFTGWLGTGSHPQWRFHERDGRLFLLTSWWDNRNLNHHLSVLAPNSAGDLVLRASLPNSRHPEPIGKPREDIFAVRYVGDRAYVVTFLQTDPLYVLDLSDPLNPRVAGELELPGFSAYLHPVGDDWLLGIGRGARGGVEANLFDVRDPASPQVHAHSPLCNACEAPLLTDYHAIAVERRDEGVTRVALPLQSWALADETRWRPYELAALLEISHDDGQMRLAGTQVADAGFTALGRVLLIGDAVFQPQNGAVTQGLWP